MSAEIEINAAFLRDVARRLTLTNHMAETGIRNYEVWIDPETGALYSVNVARRCVQLCYRIYSFKSRGYRQLWGWGGSSPGLPLSDTVPIDEYTSPRDFRLRPQPTENPLIPSEVPA